MGYYYTKRDFDMDLDSSRDFIERVMSVGESLRLDIGKGLKKKGVPGEVLLVGSTNPRRLTTVVDPRTPDDRYPCDFDVAVISEQDIPQEDRLAILTSIFPNGKTNVNYGRAELSFYRDKFPVAVAIVPESEIGKCPPIIYTRNHTSFEPEQIREMRALRLFLMRNGLYGGYTKGFKGIVLEQLAAQHGNFEDSLAWLAESINQSDNGKVIIPSPIDQSDLTNLVQKDIWSRLTNAVSRYILKGELKATPYTIESWQEDHPNALNFGLQSPLSDPHESYKLTKEALKKVTTKINAGKGQNMFIDCNVLSIPCYRCGHVLVSVNGLDRVDYDDFQRQFRSEWDKKTNANSTQCGIPYKK